MKRFTETNKWRDKWFRKLSPKSKLLWAYLCDNCDQAGVIDIDLEAASFDIGETIEPEHFHALESRFKALANGKVWIVGFIPFQYGKLSRECRPHNVIFDLLQHHGLPCEPFLHGSKPTTTQEVSQRVFDNLSDKVLDKAQDKDKEKDKEQDQDQDQRGGLGESQSFRTNNTVDGPKTEQEARSSGEMIGVDPGFAAYVWGMWFPRNGTDGAGVRVNWARYVKRRWDNEQAEWAAGNHAGNRPQGMGNGNGTSKPIPPQVQLHAVDEEISKHPANPQSVCYDRNCTALQKNSLRQLRSKHSLLTSQIANAQ